MKDFGLQILLMAIGASLILFAKGALKARQDGDAFDFAFFVASNLNRLALLGFGVLVVSGALFFDAAGLAEVLKTLPISVQVGSPLVVGAALAGLVLIVPQKTSPDEEDEE